MGFTPLEGLVMATRSGSVDPGLLLWLLEHEQLSAAELADALEHARGCWAWRAAPDMREVLDRAGGVMLLRAWRLDVYVHRLRAGIAAMAAALGGLDALVFTGGVGEHAIEIRAQAAAGLAFLGVEVDGARNDETGADGEIGAKDAAVRTLVLTAREDVEIARQVRELASTITRESLEAHGALSLCPAGLSGRQNGSYSSHTNSLPVLSLGGRPSQQKVLQLKRKARK